LATLPVRFNLFSSVVFWLLGAGDDPNPLLLLHLFFASLFDTISSIFFFRPMHSINRLFPLLLRE
jgi:hypothetical protein